MRVSLGFVFFQAEDGIRDLTVTGVQTCALPICRREARRPAPPPDDLLRDGRAGGAPALRRPSVHHLPAGLHAARRARQRGAGGVHGRLRQPGDLLLLHRRRGDGERGRCPRRLLGRPHRPRGFVLDPVGGVRVRRAARRDGERAGARRRLHRVRVRAQLRLQILPVHLADDPGHRPPDHHFLPARRPLEPDRDRETMGLRDETVEPVSAVLETVSLTKFFGMVRAAEDLSLSFQEGELVGIVGPNGSGKTTLLNVITGYVKPDRGRIRYQGKDITGLSPRAVADLGIARSFQMPQLYLSPTVLENLVLAFPIRARRAREFWAPLERVDPRDGAPRILGPFGLGGHASHDAGQLPEGARKLLDVALSFARRPRILLMDEPTSGVSARDKSKVMDTLVPVLKGTGVTTIFVEHDMEVVQRYAERVLAFDEGKVIAAGSPDAVLRDPTVRRALLGQP